MSHFHLITTSARSTLYRPKLSASLVASCAQLCLHKRSSLKMPHRGIFFTVGFKSLRILNRPKKRHPVGCPFLACPKGFEPPFSGIGIRCVIQLRHGQMYAAGYFACRFSFLIRIIFHLKINCKNCCATVFSLYYAVIIQQFFTLSKGNLSLLPTVRRSFCRTFEFFPDFVLLLLLFLQILEQF